jgi:hypothetical protein
MAVTEGQFAPPALTAQEGDVWIRLSAGGVRQRYEWKMDKVDAAQPAAMGWVGYPPQGGAQGLHFAKFSVAQYHGQWVGAQAGLAIPVPVPNAAASWTLVHNLAYRLVDITCIRALDDWTYDPGTQTWTDPEFATRPITIVMPKMVMATVTATQLRFEEPVRGLALVRR